jgi:hypothetical protein
MEMSDAVKAAVEEAVPLVESLVDQILLGSPGDRSHENAHELNHPGLAKGG